MRRGIGYVPQEHAIFARLTVRENLLLGCVASPIARAWTEVLDFFPKLAQRLGRPPARCRAASARCWRSAAPLLGRPKLLMLDEPTEGVWIGVIEEIADRLAELSQRDGVILVEQHVELALGWPSYAYVMDRGHGRARRSAAAGARTIPPLMRHLAP